MEELCGCKWVVSKVFLSVFNVCDLKVISIVEVYFECGNFFF